MTRWTPKDIPSQRGRTAVVTGTGGLGREVARILASAGATVVVAGRNAARGAAAVASIQSVRPTARVRFEALDLSDLQSVSEFGSRLRRQVESVDLLVNNAGVMTPPDRRLTADGFELQFGTNYLGHFALTAALLPLLGQSRDPRVVTVSSIAARSGRIDFDDLQSERRYQAFPAYAQSKLACLQFAIELQKRSDAAGWRLTSLAAHPGITRTDLIPNGAGPGSAAGFARRFLPFLFQPVWQGALPLLYAATSPGARPGGYYGPDRFAETRGYPAPAAPPPQALDDAIARRLWRESERLAGAGFPA